MAVVHTVWVVGWQGGYVGGRDPGHERSSLMRDNAVSATRPTSLCQQDYSLLYGSVQPSAVWSVA